FSLVNSNNQDLLQNADGIPLNKFSDTIKDFYWLNNYYVIGNVGDTIVISEIDYRDSINTVTWPTTLSLTDGTNATLNNITAFFNPRDQKLYLLNKQSLLVSEKLLP